MITEDTIRTDDPRDISAAGARTAPAVPDPRRWITLAILLISVMIATLDATVLNVAIPTILGEFHTTLPSLQWVITGYSLVFAALLIIGGRLSDLFGARRIFVIGVALFGVGSLIASISNGVLPLVLGEAVIEGIGASLMLPATMGIMASTFTGHERATAFAAWGAVTGFAVAFGPLLGGYLTTNYSWRWAFVLNVIIAPLAVLGAMVFMRRSEPAGRHQRLDIPGALLIAPGMILLVFGISEGATYGWGRPTAAFDVLGWTLWPTSIPIAITPIAFMLSATLLFSFYRLQRRKEAQDRDPLFEFSNLRRRGFRYGMIALLLLAMGQVAFLLILSVVLQGGRHLSAVQTGLWLVPSGLSIIVGSQIGNRLTRSIGTTNVVRAGLMIQTLGFVAIAVVIGPSLTLLELLPGLLLYGCGIGFAGSQINNVILSDIPPERAGALSGANTTVRMLGAAVGIALISAVLNAQTIRHAVEAVANSSLPETLRQTAIAQINAGGVTASPPTGLSVADLATLRSAITEAVFSGARLPLILSTALVGLAAAFSFLIPRSLSAGPGAGQDEELELAVIESELMAESAAVQ